MRSLRLNALPLLVLFCICIPEITSIRADPVPPGLVAHWSGDIDATGNGWDATLSGGAVAGVPGLVGGAFQFDGVDGIARTSLTLTSQGTISFWVNPDSVTFSHRMVGTFGLNFLNDRLWIGLWGPTHPVPNSLVVNLGSPIVDDFIVANPAVEGGWTHLALSFDYHSNAFVLYVNGTPSYAVSESRDAPTGALSFGEVESDWAHTSNPFSGLIDELQVYDLVLSEDEIRGLSRAPVPEASTVLLLTGGLLALAAMRRRFQ